MNMNRARPPKGCKELDLWLSGTINDAIRDATEAGLSTREAAWIALSLALSAVSRAFITRREINEWLDRRSW